MKTILLVGAFFSGAFMVPLAVIGIRQLRESLELRGRPQWPPAENT